jgi:hypothetical protein
MGEPPSGWTRLNSASIQLCQAPSHVQHAAGQVDVTASQCDQLAPPQPGERGELVGGSLEILPSAN